MSDKTRKAPKDNAPTRNLAAKYLKYGEDYVESLLSGADDSRDAEGGAVEGNQALNNERHKIVEEWRHADLGELSLAELNAAANTGAIRYPQRRAEIEKRWSDPTRRALVVSAVDTEIRAAAGLEPHQTLSNREQRLWEIIQRGSKGLMYCREVDTANIAPPRTGVWKGGPRTYSAAYPSDKRLAHWIQDEKSEITRKARLAGLASE